MKNPKMTLKVKKTSNSPLYRSNMNTEDSNEPNSSNQYKMNFGYKHGKMSSRVFRIKPS